MFVLKMKNTQLYYNCDEGLGEYLSDTPFIIDSKEKAEIILKSFLNNDESIFSLYGDEYSTKDFELQEICLFSVDYLESQIKSILEDNLFIEDEYPSCNYDEEGTKRKVISEDSINDSIQKIMKLLIQK